MRFDWPSATGYVSCIAIPGYATFVLKKLLRQETESASNIEIFSRQQPAHLSGSTTSQTISLQLFTRHLNPGFLPCCIDELERFS
ncbi:hypothetical protein SAMN05216412_10284 [Nitrosospira multiformis]|uniref:Uncharacterized protein n=1 Tax=Nitrosospira multiformis TaxID=1231 RepID=A0A1I0A2X0_9PROT|nr:hypothetical protein SAMN05216412_10284 [Nitrosospira multiformis]